MAAFVVVSVIVWGYVLSVLRRAELPAYYFVVGSSGLLIFMMLFVRPIIEPVLIECSSAALKAIFNNISFVCVSCEDTTIMLENANGIIPVNINSEDSGIFELLSFSAMLWSFPLFTLRKMVMWQAIGIFFVYSATLLRYVMAVIAFAAFGRTGFLVENITLGIIVFYSIIIVLYFLCFTRSQVYAQHFGGGATAWK